MVQHGPLVCGFDEVAEGWFIECLCGFATETQTLMESVGQEFDEHLMKVGVLKGDV